MTTALQVNIPARPAYSYPIMLAADLLQEWRKWLEDYVPVQVRKLIIITDDVVATLYGQQLSEQLNTAGYLVKLLVFPHGESSKSARSKAELEEQMFAFGCDRHTVCLALGGGVVGDLAGFTAATYMRGIKYIQIPTSLLAMIDSSVGGKTAVNTSYGKNNIGAFWQPQAVIMDISLLKSLPRQQIINGLFEAIKIFLTFDAEMFAFCQQHLDAILALNEAYLIPVLQRAVSLKAHVVEVDEHEQNLRMVLNFGHSVGHAFEKLSNFTVLHGYAVGLGMLVEAKIAELLGLLSSPEFCQISEFLARLEITPQLLTNYPQAKVIPAMRGDKKNLNQEIILVLLRAIGQVKNINNKVAFPVDEQLIATALSQLQNS